MSGRSRCRCCRVTTCSSEKTAAAWSAADEENCNWLQRAENSADGAHSIALHAAGYPNMALKRPTIKWEPTRFGIKETTWIEDVSKPRISHYVFPSHVRHSAARVGEQPRQVIRFRVPTDDVTTTTFWIDFYPHKEGKPTQTDGVVHQRI